MQVDVIESRMLYPAPSFPRSPGTHVSSVLRLIAQENGVLKRERVEEFGLIDLQEKRNNDEWWDTLPEDVQLKICMGLAWEDWYLQQLEDVLGHPGELKLDGIYLTHDGESLDVVMSTMLLVLCIHEVKLTYKSLNTIGGLYTQWLWLAQTKAYCKARGTCVAYLHVLAVCGDYTWPMRPVLKVFRIVYTQAEIDENWDVILGYVNYFQSLEREELMKDTYDAAHPST
jgi:hypothetical protein